MTTDILSTLSDAERKDLSLCGISTDEQLRTVSPQTIWNDLLAAQQYFPDHNISLTPEKLGELCGKRVEVQTPVSKPHNEQIRTAGGKVARNDDFTKQMDLRHTIAETGKEELPTVRTLEHKHGLSKHFHAIHCSHSLTVYLGAFSVLLLVPAFVLLLGTPIALLLDLLPEGVSPLALGAAFVVLVLPYILFGMRSECNVCHMNIFRFKPYSRNRSAHRYPLLGYNLSTALHILLMFQFNCPACGTALKLFAGSTKGQHAHHH